MSFSVSILNITSKTVRIGETRIPPARSGPSVVASQVVLDLVAMTGRDFTEFQHLLAAGSLFVTITGVPETFASLAPVSGSHTLGARVWNTSPVAGGNMGWVCVAAGTPGTWKQFGVIEV